MEITEVRVKLMEEPGERLQAFCSITFDDAFVVRDLKIIEGTSGPFVAMPSRKLTGHCPKCRSKNHLRAAFCNQCGQRLGEQRTAKDDDGRAKLYADIAHPINSTCREMIQQRVILAFQEEKARAKLPGYVPSYDDFEQEEAWTPPAAPPLRPLRRRRSRRRRNPAAPIKCPPRSPRTATPAAASAPASSIAASGEAEPGKGDWLRRERVRPAAETRCRDGACPLPGRSALTLFEKGDRHLAALSEPVPIFDSPSWRATALTHQAPPPPPASRYVVGFDLGTTNSAVAYVDTAEEPWQVRTFAVPQLVAAGQVEARETLPSFHYQPAAGRTAAAGCGCPGLPCGTPAIGAADQPHAVGFFARDQGAMVPGPADQLGQVVALPLGRRSHGRAAALARRGRRRAALAGRGQRAAIWPTSARPGTPASPSIRWPSRTSCSRCRPRSTKSPGS